MGRTSRLTYTSQYKFHKLERNVNPISPFLTRQDVSCYSLNPVLDIGQIEGAFMMGVGGLLLERVVYDDVTGRVVNNSTWVY